jgi:hypothetical protein
MPLFCEICCRINSIAQHEKQNIPRERNVSAKDKAVGSMAYHTNFTRASVNIESRNLFLALLAVQDKK